ncbi:cysteine-rich with EGF-like domain protein 2 [Exaiptasia diaphana]|uniref:protein disulfide-isomerase n=1 Tax=Exaiptasia diaphana TaxID=2652724 RepID=A0A913XPI0_EXADI|nr:cysteine-rich with EGF-like domain protein 2 [Exaiptasia diaphana]
MSRRDCNLLLKILFIVALSLQISIVRSKRDLKEQCKTCKDIVDAFYKGMEKTIKANFGGGNTAWEERALGSYAKSETRLVEIMEGLCESSASQCHSMVEENEETIENWWFKHQTEEKDLKTWFCINSIKVCCNNGTYGPECKECPSGKDKPCNGKGDCDGSGTRGGTGKCDCNSGYDGDECDECDDDYFEEKDEENKLKCTACHESCSKGCNGSTPKDCTECKTGWEKSEEDGCKDVDECKDADKCGEGEYCVNTPGSFDCEACHESCEGNCTSSGAKGCIACKTGYNMTEDEGCKDYDECAADTSNSLCDSGTYCRNTPGSHQCAACHHTCESCIGEGDSSCTKCSDGYKMEDNKCKDIDECAAENSPCTKENEVCENSDGSFTCECQDGYRRKGDKCVKDADSNENEEEEDEEEGDEESGSSASGEEESEKDEASPPEDAAPKNSEQESHEHEEL